MADLMKAVAIDEFGGPEKLHMCDRPQPRPAPDGIVIRVAGAGVNPADWKICAGGLEGAFPHVFPLVPGFDAAGVVEAVGAAATRFAVGDTVFGYFRKHFIGEGTYAELVSVPEDIVEACPRSISVVEAAGLPTCALSAYQAIVGALAVSAGECVAVSGAAGGVGGLAVQLATAAGARVIGLARVSNHDYVRQLGAVAAVDYNDPDLTGTLRAAAGSTGIDAALDVTGGDTLTSLMQALRHGGRVASLSDQGVKAKAAEHDVTGTYIFARSAPGHLAHIASEIDAGRLAPVRTEVLPLGDAADAHQRLKNGQAQGKLVLSVSG